mgnify:CR=1 FL=1
MKITFLAGGSSIHTVRWVNAMSVRGHDVSLITIHKEGLNNFNKKVQIYTLPIKNNLGYYLNHPIAKRIVNKIKPDIINTHYASGYGTLSRLINYKPTLLSVWGSDVYDFPYQSRMKKNILTKNLKSATEIASTSHAMKEQTEKFINNKTIHVTPFGINLNKFKPFNKKDNSQTINIGIIKTLTKKYGIKYLIKAVRILLNKLDSENRFSLKEKIRLTIVGDGEEKEYLINLTKKLEIDDITDFVGRIPYNQVSEYLNSFDIFCVPSLQESFGVAAVEASACGLPVIASNVGGLPEVIEDGVTGYIIPPKDAEKLSDKLYDLVIDKEKRKCLGERGYDRVKRLYDWNKNVDKMEEIYRSLVK